MTVDELTAHIHTHSVRTMEVDPQLFAEICQKLVTYHYDEDMGGTQEIKLYTRNGHIVYKGAELILSNKA